MPGAEGCRCESEDGVVVVIVDVVAGVVSDVKILTIKISQRMYIYSPIKRETGTLTKKNTYLLI